MTDKEKLDAIRAEVKEYISAAHKAHTNITEGNFAHLLSFIDSLQEEPKPKFKVGDCIKHIESCLGSQRTICEVCDGWYVTNQGALDFEYEDNWELVEDSVHRTKADVDAAMQDVEEKSKAFTDAHKGESAEEILVQMKGEEPILEVLAKYLDHVSHEEAMKTKGAIDRWFEEYFPEPVSENLEEAAVNYAEQFMKEVDNVEIEQAKWRNRHPEEPVVHGGIKACFLFQRDAFKAGAQWQEQKDKKTLEEEGLMIVPDEQFEKMKRSLIKLAEEKEQMLKDAVECKIGVSYENPYGGFTQLVDSKTPLVTFGKEVKLIIIKED